MPPLLTKPWSVLMPALLLCVSLPASETPAGPAVWEGLVREAYIHNPELRAAHARWAAAAEGATAAADAAAAALESTAARVRAEVLMAAADWLLVHQTQAFLAADLDLTEALENVAHQRYRAGTQSQPCPPHPLSPTCVPNSKP